MDFTFVDTHAHTYSDTFDHDIDMIVQRANDAQVTKVLLPNIDVSSAPKMFDLCDQYPDHFYPMVGLHPCSVGADFRDQLDLLLPCLDDDRVLAVGEMGTDLYWDKTYIEEQKEAFRIQVRWAKERSLPIVIHCRDSIDLTIALVREMWDESLRGVFHCFGGTEAQSAEIADMGFYFGIGGVSTFKKSVAIREMIASLPEDKILLETDAPYLTPHPHRGKRNESSYIPMIAQVVAAARDMSIEELAQTTSNNAKRLFNL